MEKSKEIQEFANGNEDSALYIAIKAIYSPMHKANSPVKSADGTSLQYDNAIINP